MKLDFRNVLKALVAAKTGEIMGGIVGTQHRERREDEQFGNVMQAMQFRQSMYDRDVDNQQRQHQMQLGLIPHLDRAAQPQAIAALAAGAAPPPRPGFGDLSQGLAPRHRALLGNQALGAATPEVPQGPATPGKVRLGGQEFALAPPGEAEQEEQLLQTIKADLATLRSQPGTEAAQRSLTTLLAQIGRAPAGQLWESYNQTTAATRRSLTAFRDYDQYLKDYSAGGDKVLRLRKDDPKLAEQFGTLRRSLGKLRRPESPEDIAAFEAWKAQAGEFEAQLPFGESPSEESIRLYRDAQVKDREDDNLRQEREGLVRALQGAKTTTQYRSAVKAMQDFAKRHPGQSGYDSEIDDTPRQTGARPKPQNWLDRANRRPLESEPTYETPEEVKARNEVSALKEMRNPAAYGDALKSTMDLIKSERWRTMSRGERANVLSRAAEYSMKSGLPFLLDQDFQGVANLTPGERMQIRNYQHRVLEDNRDNLRADDYLKLQQDRFNKIELPRALAAAKKAATQTGSGSEFAIQEKRLNMLMKQEDSLFGIGGKYDPITLQIEHGNDPAALAAAQAEAEEERAQLEIQKQALLEDLGITLEPGAGVTVRQFRGTELQGQQSGAAPTRYQANDLRRKLKAKQQERGKPPLSTSQLDALIERARRAGQLLD